MGNALEVEQSSIGMTTSLSSQQLLAATGLATLSLLGRRRS
jgi:hypothetical protein